MVPVVFRGYTFSVKHVEKVTVGAPINRVKLSRYPGVKGAISMDMRRAERTIVQNGVLREATQALLLATRDKVISLCDGTQTATAATGLSVHGEVFNTVYADSLELGPQFKAKGGGSPGGTIGDYVAQPYTITYIQPNP